MADLCAPPRAYSGISSADTVPDIESLATLVIKTSRDIFAKHDIGPGHGKRRNTKVDGSPVTEVDLQMQSTLHQQLLVDWPQFGFIGEEMEYQEQVMESEAMHTGYWVLDPLDGTTNFSCGFPFYGVSLALVIDGTAVLGVVYDPVRDECFTAVRGQGAWLNGVRLKTPAVRSLERCIANIDYRRLVGELAFQLVQCPPYSSQRNLGSSVLEWCWLAAGRVQLYLHGGQKLWDFAAGHCILQEAGGAATTLSGARLDCRLLHKRSVIAAVNRPLLDKWHLWLKEHSDDPRSISILV